MALVFRRRISARLLMLAFAETCLIVGAVEAGTRLRLGGDGWPLAHGTGLANVLLITAVCQLCFYYRDLYDRWVLADRRELFVRILQSLGAASALLAAVYYWFPTLVIGRGVFALAAGIVLVTVIAWRVAFEWLTRRMGPRERLLIVGTNDAALLLARELHERRELGVQIVGFIDPDPARVGTPLINPGIIGTFEDIPAIARARNVDRVVVNLANTRGTLPMDKLLQMRVQGITFDHLASVYEEYTGKIALENLRPSWFIFSSGFRKSRALRAVKRTLDVTVAAAGLVLALPLLLVIAALVRLTSRGPVLYHQRRVGQHGRVFTIHKIRSMRIDAEAESGPVWARAGDGRTTRIGRWLRRARLDELPQLWNVLRGDMSLVGPRPERPEFVEGLQRTLPYYGERHAVRPGVTGWAQVRYTYAASVENAAQKLQYDLYYVKNLSIALDLFILFETIRTVLLRPGSA